MSASKDNSIKKVYINPNFTATSIVNKNMLLNKNFMYVNRQFSNLRENETKNKIFVNPNFMRSAPRLECNPISFENSDVKNIYECNIDENISLKKTADRPATVPDNRVVTSRYSLIRNKDKSIKENLNSKTNTFKLNKYKSVPFTDIRRRTMDIQNSYVVSRLPKLSNIHLNKIGSDNLNLSKTKYNEINKNIGSVSKKLCNRRKIFIESSKLRKNNIPCPLFKKFGKCIRQIKGNCKFLHDKKHVAICRKFLKGICHEDTCLLSHDITSEKMPTCYFYLKGMCTKENCPYLHVKLNKNSKLCSDFLKGYCERGTKCEYRHVNITNETKKRLMRTKQITLLKVKNQHTEKPNKNESVEESQNERNMDCRYYRDIKPNFEDTKADCGVIKPIRCKLGNLPSFIQFE